MDPGNRTDKTAGRSSAREVLGYTPTSAAGSSRRAVRAHWPEG
jgi:hypothetical protein